MDIPRENPGKETDKIKSIIEVITTTKSKVLNVDRKNNINPRPYILIAVSNEKMNKNDIKKIKYL